MITTDNLILTPVCEADLDIYSAILGCNELTKYLPKGEAYTAEEIELYFHNRVQHWQHGFGSYTVRLTSNPETKIGYVGVEQCQDPAYSDIRYALLPDYQGKGYVFEAAQAVISETFKANKHDKIYGVALEANVASLAILKKLGMTREINTRLYGEVEGLETFALDKYA